MKKKVVIIACCWVFGDRRDEEPDAQGAQEKEAGGEEESRDAPGQRDLEPEEGEEHDHDHLADGDDRIGDGLADDQFDRLERRHDELLHRPRLPFLDDGDRGQQKRDQHDDEGDDPGTKKFWLSRFGLYQVRIRASIFPYLRSRP